MFKLILHHTYKLLGEAIDVSHNDNHGFRTAVNYLADGRATDSGALQFAGGPSRVRVTTKPVWQNLRAVKVETWVRLTALGQRRNLVEADRAFAFFIHPDGVLWGTFLGPETPGGAPTWHGANSQANAPDGITRTVPLNQWTKLTYVHDGIASLRLYIDGQLVAANYTLVSSVPSVQPNGIHIGHWTGDDRYTFHGEIDEVKIWKYDPDVPYKQLFCRPMDDKQMACWQAVFDDMAALLRDRERSRQFIGAMLCLWRAVEDFVRAIRSKGEEAIGASSKFSTRYRELWCSGKVDGEEMRRLLTEWREWVRSLLGESYLADFRQRIQACWREFGGDQGAFGDLTTRLAECDPAFAGYIKLFIDLFGEEPPVEPPTPPDEPSRPPKSLIDQIAEIVRALWKLILRLLRPRK